MDEADIDLVGGSSSQSSGRGVKRPAESPNPIPLRPSKRKAGPLPRDLCVRRPFSPMPSSSPSSPSSATPITSLLAELPVRPDSPIPSVTSPTFSPSIGRDSEEESGSLVIADYDDTPDETSFLNGTSKPVEDTPCEHQTVTSTSVQVLPESESVTTPDLLVTAPLFTSNHLLNGETKGLFIISGLNPSRTPSIDIQPVCFFFIDGYVNHENSNHTVPFLSCTNSNEKLTVNGISKQVDTHEIHHHNLQVKSAAYRAIKRPGRSEYIRFLGYFS